MKICPRCKHENRDRALFCEVCGRLLAEQKQEERDEEPTRQLNGQEQPGVLLPVARGTRTFGDHMRLVLEAGPDRRVLPLSDGQEVRIGRADRMVAVTPSGMIALGSWEHGISRQHAAIRRTGNEIFVIDLDSTNGTFLNLSRVPPGVPQLIRDGDVIRLGLLDVKVSFVAAKETAIQSAAQSQPQPSSTAPKEDKAGEEQNPALDRG